MLGWIGGRRRRGTTEDEMAGWHHQLDAHEFEESSLLRRLERGREIGR